jgi:hypothetical protein
MKYLWQETAFIPTQLQRTQKHQTRVVQANWSHQITSRQLREHSGKARNGNEGKHSKRGEIVM